MSYQSYVDEEFVGSGHVPQALICGLDGNTIASSSGFRLNAGEGNTLVGLFKNSGEARSHGVSINGIKYNINQANGRSISGSEILYTGNQGISCVKTGYNIVIGVYNGAIQSNQCARTVENLADFLVENNYISVQ